MSLAGKLLKSINEDTSSFDQDIDNLTNDYLSTIKYTGSKVDSINPKFNKIVRAIKASLKDGSISQEEADNLFSKIEDSKSKSSDHFKGLFDYMRGKTGDFEYKKITPYRKKYYFFRKVRSVRDMVRGGIFDEGMREVNVEAEVTISPGAYYSFTHTHEVYNKLNDIFDNDERRHLDAYKIKCPGQRSIIVAQEGFPYPRYMAWGEVE